MRAIIRESILKQQENGHEAKYDFETLDQKIRAAALDLENRSHTNVSEDQAAQTQMTELIRTNKTGLLQGRERKLLASGHHQRG